MTADTQIDVYDVLPHRYRADVWQMYLSAFEPMRTLAAQRHVMFYEEYIDLMADDRVQKVMTRYVTPAGDRPVGLAVVSNQLEAFPLIEPLYFQHREPKLAEMNRIWYVGFVCEQQGRPKPPKDNFRRLIEKVAEPIRPVRGACFMDYATVRVNDGLPHKANNLLALGDPDADYEKVDAQTYWVYYPGGRPR